MVLENASNVLYFNVYISLVQLVSSHATQEGENERSQDRKVQEPNSPGKRGRHHETMKLLGIYRTSVVEPIG